MITHYSHFLNKTPTTGLLFLPLADKPDISKKMIKMFSFWHEIVVVLVGLSLAGCAGLSLVQDTIKKYRQGVHSISSAEMNFYRSAQTAECTSYFYKNASKWAEGTVKEFDISGVCIPQTITDERIIRQQELIDKIILYADKIDALASSENDKTLSNNAKEVTEKIESILKTYDIFDLSAGTEVEVAIVGISEMGMDRKKLTEIKKAAKKMEPYLETVIKKMKEDNLALAAGIETHLSDIRKSIEKVLAKDRKTGIRRLLNLVEARHLLQTASPFGRTPLVQTKGAENKKKVPKTVALKLNNALDAVLLANRAIVNADTGSIAASVKNLVFQTQALDSIQLDQWKPFVKILQ